MADDVLDQSAEQKDAPILKVEATCTPENYLRYTRYLCKVNCIKHIAGYFMALFLALLGFILYYYFQNKALGFEQITVLDVILNTFESMDAYFWILVGGYVIFCTVYYLTIRPRQALKIKNEMIGDGAYQVTYLFYEDRYETRLQGSNGTMTHDKTMYQKIRSIWNNQYAIRLKTRARNYHNFIKETFSYEDEQRILNVLRDHCRHVRSIQEE